MTVKKWKLVKFAAVAALCVIGGLVIGMMSDDIQEMLTLSALSGSAFMVGSFPWWALTKTRSELMDACLSDD